MQNDRVRRMLTALLAVTSASACTSGEDQYAPGEVAGAVRKQWLTAEILVDGDDFSDSELRCIDRVGEALTGDDVEVSTSRTFAEAPEAVQDFMESYFDECLTDAHLQRWFFTDMTDRPDLAFTDEKSACLSQALVGLVRREGFADVFRDLAPDAAAELEQLRQACGIFGPNATTP
jgi:hypothetical protein